MLDICETIQLDLIFNVFLPSAYVQTVDMAHLFGFEILIVTAQLNFNWSWEWQSN